VVLALRRRGLGAAVHHGLLDDLGPSPNKNPRMDAGLN
jgi:hypothetical protein